MAERKGRQGKPPQISRKIDTEKKTAPDRRPWHRGPDMSAPGAITGEQIAAMLREAGAKEPWSAPELCPRLALHLTFLSQQTEPSRRPKPGPEHKAWEVMLELRRILPALRAQYTFAYEAEYSGPGPEQKAAIDRIRSEKLAQLQAITEAADGLQVALAAYIDERPRREDFLEGTWHGQAVALWNAYLLIVGKAAPSKNSPAVRFVEDGLKLFGWGDLQRRGGRIVPPTRDSIEKALRRAGVVQVKPKDDKTAALSNVAKTRRQPPR